MYPNGGAAANRHMALFKSLANDGNQVDLYSCKYRTDHKSALYNVKSVLGGNNIIFKLLSLMIFILNTCLSIFLKGNKNSVVVYLGTSGLVLLPFLLVCKLKKIAIYHERTELPSLMVGKSKVAKFDFYIYKKFLSSFDSIFLITEKLKDEFLTYPSIVASKLHIMNMMVDMARFNNVDKMPSDELKLITFCGDLSSSKDDVDILIMAFKKVLQILPNIELKLIGDQNTTYFMSVIEPLIQELDIRESIIITGRIEAKKVPYHLLNSDLLVLSRSNSVQAQFGFPTKLGEYLASSTPVLVTETSEIAFFLKDEVNAYLAIAGDTASFANKIIKISMNYEHALDVGRKGKEVANKYFCSDVVAHKFHSVVLKAAV
jgi:glycosyltransferase involved in cell wall biosynthesis